MVVARDDPVVDRVLDDERRGDGARLPEQAGEHGARDAMPLRAHDRAHESPRRGAASFEFPHGPNLPTDDDNPIEQRFPRPSVMGVVNVTPDSFSDGGVNFDPDDAVASARRMLDGGRGDRRRRRRVDAARRRGASPWTRSCAASCRCSSSSQGAPVSIDTSKAEVARRALELGAELVNDVTALRGDPALAEVVAGVGRLPLPDAHAGRAADDAGRPALRRRRLGGRGLPRGAAAARRSTAGIAEERICLDPGIGFGKTVEHNFELVRRLDELTALGRPVVIGFSRKSSLGKLLGDPQATTGSVAASVGAAVAAYERGATILRVHDVREHVEALAAAQAALA